MIPVFKELEGSIEIKRDIQDISNIDVTANLSTLSTVISAILSRDFLNLSQQHICKKIKIYLKYLQGRDQNLRTLREVSILSDIGDISKFDEGRFCCGLSSLWLVCMMQQKLGSKFLVEKYDINWFFTVLSVLSEWGENKKNSLTELSTLILSNNLSFVDINLFVSQINFLQNPQLYLSSSFQGDLDNGSVSNRFYDEGVLKENCFFTKEYSIASVFSLDNIKQLLTSIVHKNKLILIDSDHHATALFKSEDLCSGKIYYYFEPDDKKLLYETDDINIIAEKIFNSHKYSRQDNTAFIPLGFRIFSIDIMITYNEFIKKLEYIPSNESFIVRSDNDYYEISKTINEDYDPIEKIIECNFDFARFDPETNNYVDKSEAIYNIFEIAEKIIGKAFKYIKSTDIYKVCIYKKYPSVVSILDKLNSEPIFYPTKHGICTGLAKAAYINCLDSVDYWINKAKEHFSQQTEAGHEKYLEFINYHDSSNYKYNAVEWAAFNGHEGIVKILLESDVIENTYEKNLLFAIVRNNRINVLKTLLNIYKNIDINVIDDKGLSPIIYAICNNDFKIAEILLKHPQIDLNTIKYNLIIDYNSRKKRKFTLIEYVGYLINKDNYSYSAELRKMFLCYAIDNMNYSVLAILLNCDQKYFPRVVLTKLQKFLLENGDFGVLAKLIRHAFENDKIEILEIFWELAKKDSTNFNNVVFPRLKNTYGLDVINHSLLKILIQPNRGFCEEKTICLNKSLHKLILSVIYTDADWLKNWVMSICYFCKPENLSNLYLDYASKYSYLSNKAKDNFRAVFDIGREDGVLSYDLINLLLKEDDSSSNSWIKVVEFLANAQSLNEVIKIKLNNIINITKKMNYPSNFTQEEVKNFIEDIKYLQKLESKLFAWNNICRFYPLSFEYIPKLHALTVKNSIGNLLSKKTDGNLLRKRSELKEDDYASSLLDVKDKSNVFVSSQEEFADDLLPFDVSAKRQEFLKKAAPPMLPAFDVKDEFSVFMLPQKKSTDLLPLDASEEEFVIFPSVNK